jgi:S-DNA-T family DNA segregation ATPase FtsK/SpoIIIE
VLLWIVIAGLGRLVCWFVRHPRFTVAIGLVCFAELHGTVGRAAIWAALALGMAWRLVHPPSFERLVEMPMRIGWKRFWRYGWQWKPTMRTCGLASRADGVEAVPRVSKVRCSPCVDHVLVRMPKGHAPHDFERVLEELAHAMRADSCRVRVHRPGWVWLDFVRDDPLVAPLGPPPEGHADLHGVVVGTQEDGRPWRVRLLGTHVLVAGVTGSGKGSVIWSLLHGLGPWIRYGMVEAWAVDPKGGMELGIGRPLFARFASESYDEMADLLDDAVEMMQRRAIRLSGVTRQHVPTMDDPMVVIVVDEVANLTAYAPDRKVRDRCDAALSLLLTQGRAVGVNVVAALQDPRKEVLRFRNLFPTKIALRLDEPSQVDMVLGDGARDRGARCDEIPEMLPGVGYVRLDGMREPVRVRASYVSDERIRTLAAKFQPTYRHDFEDPAA